MLLFSADVRPAGLPEPLLSNVEYYPFGSCICWLLFRIKVLQHCCRMYVLEVLLPSPSEFMVPGAGFCIISELAVKLDELSSVSLLARAQETALVKRLQAHPEEEMPLPGSHSASGSFNHSRAPSRASDQTRTPVLPCWVQLCKW